MKVYKEAHGKSILSDGQLLDMVDVVCLVHNLAFVLGEYPISSYDVEKVGEFAVRIKHDTHVFYKLPGRNEMYGSVIINGTYEVLHRVNGSQDYVLCSIIQSNTLIVPDGYTYIGGI